MVFGPGGDNVYVLIVALVVKIDELRHCVYQSHFNNGLSSNGSVIIYKVGNVMQREGQKQN
jgi:hypothetical protein